MSPLVAWALSLVLWKASPLPAKGYEETPAVRQARIEAIAADVVAVAFDPAESPLFGGRLGRARTAAALLAVAYHESGFARDVDLGPCSPSPRGRCDGGASACILQIRVGAGTTREGWTRAELFTDRQKCFRAGLHLMRRSAGACARDGADHLFDAYAGGSCSGVIAHGRGLELLTLSRVFFDHTKVPPS